MPGTFMSRREWARTKGVRKLAVREFGLATWGMLTAAQADTVVVIAARYGLDAADRYLAPINAANWSAVHNR
jgi:hypothetical protein